ncbi:uncharacterized protein LOC130973833 [Arachis stenosperma]|uniref:uncharacterized protein LOC130973833 n=1 Tax=Arachis stenosperma TaxID=217475 RepID=UPI0025AC912D|nr:uncharacterized protein LOC130973833 [Arachis stenosperma]
MAMDLSRITVRPFKLADADDMLLWAGDDRVTGNTRLDVCVSKEQAIAFIRDECMAQEFKRSICMDDRSIGIIWVIPWLGEDNFKADLGYALGFKYWGKGIATKAVKIVLSQVFNVLPYLKRLQAFTLVENKASQRVLQKVGFQREGMLRKFIYFKGNFEDFLVHSFLSTDEIPPLD